jgi:hypothetical protein
MRYTQSHRGHHHVNPTQPNTTTTRVCVSHHITYPRGVRELEDVDGGVGRGLLLQQVGGAPGGAAEHVVVEDGGEHGAVVDPRGVLPDHLLLHLLIFGFGVGWRARGWGVSSLVWLAVAGNCDCPISICRWSPSSRPDRPPMHAYK